jgi:hypothetical protein
MIWKTLPAFYHAHFRDGTGLKEVFTPAAFASYREFAQDCMGPWLVWWRQNFPGLDNVSRDHSDAPMRNWWPYLFY